MMLKKTYITSVVICGLLVSTSSALTLKQDARPYAAATVNQKQYVKPYAAGSTPNLEEIFLGRCYEHQDCLQTDRCIPNE